MMNNYYKLGTKFNAGIPDGKYLPLVSARDYQIIVSFPNRNAYLRPLPLMDSMCPVCACTGAGCGEQQDV
jgi:hypothetical protein